MISPAETAIVDATKHRLRAILLTSVTTVAGLLPMAYGIGGSDPFAAPMALAAAGVHSGHKVTSYPGFADKMAGAEYVEERVVRDGQVITSRGPGTALGLGGL